MNFIASWGVHNESDLRAGNRMTVTTSADVEALVERLAKATSQAAKIIHQARPPVRSALSGELEPDHMLWAGIWQGYGYLIFGDDEDLWFPVGDPASPVYHSDSDEYDAGSGLPIETFTEALKEFLATAHRPTCVEWRATL
ncbi:Imm1 family immunity protein [Actinosynnema sp. CS-041913]|uniref:Imm1 family immunity protein n=1 Tax=Actinosynnema sp. CS-041913 TaxID=3239917 RepID=UPI003D8AA810